MRIPVSLVASIVSVLAVAAAAAEVPSAPAKRFSADEQAVLASFQLLLAGLGQRDKVAMLAQSLPGGHATLMRKGKPLQMTLDELADKVSAPGKDSHEETIRDPMVRIDDDVAIIWARFEFLVNGKVDHCGRDVATLVRVDGRWLVASLEDTASTACGG